MRDIRSKEQSMYAKRMRSIQQFPFAFTDSFPLARLTGSKSPGARDSGNASRFPSRESKERETTGFRVHRDNRVAASNAPRKCPGGKGWIGGGAQASSSSYRRLDARAEGEKRTSLSVVVEVPVGVERECKYVRLCIAVCFCECISSGSHDRAGGKTYKDD